MTILKLIGHLFNMKSIYYSIYIMAGFVLSHYSHVYVYRIRGGKSLMTWFKLFNIIDKEPSVKLVYIFCLILIVIQFIMLQLTIPKATVFPPSSIFKIGIIYSLIFLLISQLISSSIMRLSYETLICFIVLIGILITQIFLISNKVSLERYQELWDLLKFVTPLCIGIPILMGSAGFITSFYQNEQNVIQMQLYRHIAMTLYFSLGTFFFVIYPIVSKIFHLREKLF